MSSNRNPGALVGGSLLIAFGILALLGQVFRFSFWNTFWPFIIIAFGAMFFVGMVAGGKSVSGLAIPGSIFVGIGLMLFYQNITSHWESWSYGWTLILMFVGIGIYIMGAWGNNPEQKRSGLRVLRIGLILFIIFGAFFELIFSMGTPFNLRSIFFPAALILLGLYLVLTRSGILPRSSGLDNKPEIETKSEIMEEE